MQDLLLNLPMVILTVMSVSFNSYGIISIGFNSVGVVSIGINAVGVIAIGGINAIGVISVSGVNAIGFFCFAGVNCLALTGRCLRKNGFFNLKYLIKKALSRAMNLTN